VSGVRQLGGVLPVALAGHDGVKSDGAGNGLSPENSSDHVAHGLLLWLYAFVCILPADNRFPKLALRSGSAHDIDVKIFVQNRRQANRFGHPAPSEIVP
jgi:hypothetical protein